MTSSVVTRSVFNEVFVKHHYRAKFSIYFQNNGSYHELPVKLASYHGKPRVTSKIKKI